MEPVREFGESQARLAERARAGTLTVVDLDPDGTWPPWAAVVVLRPTCVAYAHQCAGLACQERLAEGYLVPLAGPRRDPDEGRLDPLGLSAPFHAGQTCTNPLTAANVDRLAALVAGVAYWSRGTDGEALRTGLTLDRARAGELTEGWAPVETPDGPGLLLWSNCD